MKLPEELNILNTSLELITSYVNYSTCCFPEDRRVIVETVLPRDTYAKKYFYILLLEMIAPVNKEIISSKNTGDNLLSLLLTISEYPLLGDVNCTNKLKLAVESFTSWLESEFEYDPVTLDPSFRTIVMMTRKDALYLIGNRCKHVLTRSNGVIKKISKIYIDSGAEINREVQRQLLEDIDTTLYDGFASYHFTKLCELSLNVYWGIHDYVFPVYQRLLIQDEGIKYSYSIPEDVNSQADISVLYDLLNSVRTSFLPQVKTHESLTKRY